MTDELRAAIRRDGLQMIPRNVLFRFVTCPFHLADLYDAIPSQSAHWSAVVQRSSVARRGSELAAPPSPREGRRRQFLRYAEYATVAAILVALGAVAGYLLRLSPPPGPKQDMARNPEPPEPLRVSECRFDLIRPGPGGPILEGIVGRTPLVARRGDALSITLKLNRPGHAIVLARRPNGTIRPLLPAREEENPTPTESATVYVPIDQDGEWFVAALAVPDADRCWEALRAILAEPGFTSPLGTDDVMAYADGKVTTDGVRGQPPTPRALTAQDRFKRVCQQLGDRFGVPLEAIALPVRSGR